MPGQVVDAASAQHRDGAADLLQRDAGVEQPLDHLEHEDVAETVEALGARAAGRAHGRLDQAGAGPVVELAVGDAGRLAGGGAAVAGLLVELGQVALEQHALRGHRGTPGLPRFSGGDHVYLLSSTYCLRLYAHE